MGFLTHIGQINYIKITKIFPKWRKLKKKKYTNKVISKFESLELCIMFGFSILFYIKFSIFLPSNCL